MQTNIWNKYLLSGHSGYKDFDYVGQKSAVVEL